MANERRLIDANALRERHCEGCKEDIREMCRVDPICASLQWVDEEPTVDAVEVVHGRWEDVQDFGGGNCFGYCSNCKTPQKAQNATALKAEHRYCRWCGAKMDGDWNG